MITKKNIITLLVALILCAVIGLAYTLGYKNAEEDFFQRQQLLNSLITGKFDPAEMSAEEQKLIEERKLELEKQIEELPF